MTSPYQQDEQRGPSAPHDNIESLLQENAALREDLEDCKNQLVEVLQTRNDITESDIKAAFTRVYSGIEVWIDELGSEDGYEEAFRDQSETKIWNGSGLESLGFHRRCYSDEKWCVKFSNLPNCFHIIMSMVISKFLTDNIFRTAKADEWGHLYPHGLKEHEIKHLIQLQEVMRTKLRRDESEISRWRGQSISAMITLDGARDLAKKASDKHVKVLQGQLLEWLGKDITQQLSDSLTENVIDRANRSLEMMCCSNKTYRIGGLEFPPGPIKQHEARAWHLRELSTWRKISPQADGDLLQCLRPGLIREGESGQDDLMLVKPTWIGYEKPGQLPEDSGQSPPPASRSSSPQRQSSNIERHSGRDQKNRSKKARTQSKHWNEVWHPFRSSPFKSARSVNKSTPTDSVEQYARKYTGEESHESRVPTTRPAASRGSSFHIAGEEYYDQTKQGSRRRRSLSH